MATSTTPDQIGGSVQGPCKRVEDLVERVEDLIETVEGLEKSVELQKTMLRDLNALVLSYRRHMDLVDGNNESRLAVVRGVCGLVERKLEGNCRIFFALECKFSMYLQQYFRVYLRKPLGGNERH